MTALEVNTTPTVTIPDYVITGETLIGNDITDIPKLVEPIFPKVGVIALSGSSDTGKSSLLRQLALEIVLKKESFLGFPINATHNSILYVTTEDDYYALSSLIKKQNVDRKPAAEFKPLRFIFDTSDLTKKINEQLKRQPVDAVIIDAFADLYAGNMNQVNEVRNYLQEFSNIAQQHGCLIIFLHHTSKRTEDSPPSKHNMIGSQGFEAKMRVVIELRRDYNDPSGDRRHLCIVKGNYLDDSYKNRSFELRFTSNLTFESTGRRVPFESLAPANGRQANVEARDRARELRHEGLTISQILEQLTEEGINVSRSAIGNYVRGLNG